MATSSDSIPGPDYVDFDEYIDIQLSKTGSTIKSTDVLTAVVGVLTFVGLYLLTFVVCDHWLVPGGVAPLARGILLAIVVTACCVWVGAKVIWPWRRRVTGLYAAKTIENASPGLKSSVLNLIDLSESGREIRPEIYESIERRAALALSHVDVNEVVDRRSLLHHSLALLATVVFFCMYWVISPKNPATSLWRAIAPTADSRVATRTEITAVRPGDVDVIARSQLDVTADLQGEIPQQAWLYFSTADHKFVDEKIEMRLVDEATKQFRCTINGENGAGILQDMTYRITAGDAATSQYKIRVMQPPAATIESIRLDYPEYTEREPVTQSSGAIDALEGTRVTLRATANMPLRSPAQLQFFDDQTASKQAEVISVHVTDGTRLEAQWKLEIRSDNTSPHYFRIFCTNTKGESDPNPSLYSLTIRPDLPPEVTLREPKTDLELPANAVLPLAIEARDPDFKLRDINLKVEKNGSPILGPEVFDGRARQFNKTFEWSLSEYHFRPKDTVTYWVQAQDNRQPIANTANTPKLKIRIVNPVSEQQVKKNLEAEKKRQQQQDVENLNAARSANENRDDDDSNAPKPMEQPQRPKQQPQPNASKPQPSDPKAAENENAGQEGNEQGENGGAGQGQGKDQNGKKDQNSANEDNKDRKERLDPSNSEDDAKVLQKLLDQQKREQKDDKGSQGAGKGDRSNQNESQVGDQSNSSKDGKTGKSGDENSAQEKPGSKGRRDVLKEDKNGETPIAKRQDSPSENSKPVAEPKSGHDQSAKPDEHHKSPGDKQPPQKQDSQGKNSRGQNSADHDRKDGSSQGGADGKSKPDQPKDGKTDQANGKGGAGHDDSAPQNPGVEHKNPGKPNSESSNPEKSNPEKSKPEKSKPEKSESDKSNAGKGNPEKSEGDQRNANHKNNEPPKGDASSQPNDAGNPNEAKDEKGHPKDQKGNNDGQSDSSRNNNQQNESKPAAGKEEKKPGEQNSPESKDRKFKESGQKDKASKDDHATSNSPERGNQPGDSQNSGQQNNSNDRQNEARKNESGGDQNTNGRKTDNAAKDKDQNPGRSDTRDGKPARPTEQKDNAARDDDDNNRNEKGERKARPANESSKKNPADQDAGENDKANPSKSPDANSKPKKAKENQRPDKDRDDQKNISPQDVPAVPKRPDHPRPKPGLENRLPTKDQTLKQPQSKNSDDSQNSSEQSQQPERSRSAETKEKVEKDQAASQSGAEQQGKPSADQSQTDRKESSQFDPKDAAQKDAAQNGAAQQGNPKGKPSESGKPSDQSQQSQSAGKESKSGGKESQSAKGKSGKPSDQGKSESPGSDGKSSDSGKGSPSSAGGKPGEGEGNTKSNQGGGHHSGQGSGGGEALQDTTGNANLDYAKKATDLVLRTLDGQLKRGKVDQKTLDELGWNEDQVRRFVDRMRKQAQSFKDATTPADETRRLQFLETLRSLDIQSPGGRRTGNRVPKRQAAEFEAAPSTPPPEYRELYEAFTKSLSRGSAPSNDAKK